MLGKGNALVGRSHGPLEQIHVLLVRQISHPQLYRAEVLKQAGFRVRVATPRDFPKLLHDATDHYDVAVLCHSLKPEDARTIAGLLRRHHSRTRIIVIDGPEPHSIGPSLRDLTIDSLDGPEVLIGGIRRLCPQANS